MSDGAGIIEAVGIEVTDFAVGDQIVSTFFLYWQQGDALRGVALQLKGSQRPARTYWRFALAVCRFLHLNWPSRCEGYRDLFMSRRSV
jgi:hypothetical protein